MTAAAAPVMYGPDGMRLFLVAAGLSGPEQEGVAWPDLAIAEQQGDAGGSGSARPMPTWPPPWAART